MRVFTRLRSQFEAACFLLRQLALEDFFQILLSDEPATQTAERVVFVSLRARLAFQIWSNSNSKFRKLNFKFHQISNVPNILKFPNYHSNLFPSISIQKLPQSKENPFSSPETKRRLYFWGVPHGVTPKVRPRGKRNVSIPVICSRLVYFAPGLVAVEHREGAADGVGILDQSSPLLCGDELGVVYLTMLIDVELLEKLYDQHLGSK